MSDQLTPNQRAFVREYHIDGNGKQAAIRAGYSERTAAEQASRLLNNVNVQAELKRLSEQQEKRARRTKDDLLQELDDILEDPTISTKDRMKAVELYGKHLAMWTVKSENSGNVTVTVRHVEEPITHDE